MAVGRRTLRPINKNLIAVEFVDVTSTQQSQTLVTAVSACTVMGIRWSFFVASAGGTEGIGHTYKWSIVLVQDGSSITAMSDTTGSKFYTPEKDVLAFGAGMMTGSGSSAEKVKGWQGKTGSMRKLMIGDRIVFLMKGLTTQTTEMQGVVQLFCKF